LKIKKDEKRKASEKLNKERGCLVVKRNDFVQNSHHQLSLLEQKIILFVISKIKPLDTDFTEQLFSIADFCRFCGLDEKNGKNYRNLKDALGKLLSRYVWISLDNGSITSLRWVDKVTINKGSGIIQLKLDKDLKPYFLQLEEQYTLYELRYILSMRSQYSVRLYELLKSYSYKKNVVFEVNELKRLLFSENWERNNDFKRKVLDIAVREINEFSDIFVEYIFQKDGRRFSKVWFAIDRKEAYDRFMVGEKVNRLLSK